MRTRAQRRYFAEIKKKRKEQIHKIIGKPCYMRYTECDWCYFFGHSNCAYLPNPRKEWGRLTRQEIRAADREKAYRDYVLWRKSR